MQTTVDTPLVFRLLLLVNNPVGTEQTACQLLAQGKHLEMERAQAPQEVDQGGNQRNKYRFHADNATWPLTEKSGKSLSTEFLVGTSNYVRQQTDRKLDSL